MAISAQFTADFTAWKASVADAAGDMGKLTEATEKITPAVGLVAADAGRQIRALGTDVLALGKNFLSAYQESETAAAGLTAALEAQGLSANGVVEKYAEMASKMQETTRFADDAVTRSQEIFTSIGKLGPEQMQPALDAAANLAIAMKTDLPTAATIMAKAFGSGGESLGKLKQLLGESGADAKSFDEILAALNAQFGGQAAKDMETSAGQLASLNNQFGEVEETVGGLIARGLTPIMNFFTSLPEPVQTVIATVGVLGTALAPIAVAFAALVTTVTPLLALLGGTAGLSALLATVGGALAAIAAPVAIAVAAIGAVYLAFKHWDQITAIVSSVYDAVKTYLVDKFNALVSSITAPINAVVNGFKTLYDKVVGHSYVPDMVNGVADQFGRLDSVMTKPAQEASKAVAEAFDAATRAWIDSPFNRMSKNFMTVLTDSGGVAHDMAGRPVAVGGELGGIARSMGQQNIQVTINGSVLSTQEQISMAMSDAMMQSFRQGGGRVPI